MPVEAAGIEATAHLHHPGMPLHRQEAPAPDHPPEIRIDQPAAKPHNATEGLTLPPATMASNSGAQVCDGTSSVCHSRHACAGGREGGRGRKQVTRARCECVFVSHLLCVLPASTGRTHGRGTQLRAEREGESRSCEQGA